MTRRMRRLRGLFSVVVLAGAAAGACLAWGCNTATLAQNTPCTGSGCTCEQDPTQQRCRGYNDRPESGAIDRSDARAVDAGDAGEPADAELDGPADGGDEAG